MRASCRGETLSRSYCRCSVRFFTTTGVTSGPTRSANPCLLLAETRPCIPGMPGSREPFPSYEPANTGEGNWSFSRRQCSRQSTARFSPANHERKRPCERASCRASKPPPEHHFRSGGSPSANAYAIDATRSTATALAGLARSTPELLSLH